MSPTEKKPSGGKRKSASKRPIRKKSTSGRRKTGRRSSSNRRRRSSSSAAPGPAEHAEQPPANDADPTPHESASAETDPDSTISAADAAIGGESRDVEADGVETELVATVPEIESAAVESILPATESSDEALPAIPKPGDAEKVFYGDSVRVVTPESYDELREVVREHAAAGKVLIPSGVGAHAYLGNVPAGEVVSISLRRLDRVLRYEEGDFTVGVQAGITNADLKRELAAHGQQIAVDLPRSARSTVGGAVAANWSGPRRGRLGGFRNYVIGVGGMRGDGTIYRAGGMVVKNVAGYDIGKALVGSLGTLGFILEVNFKLRPIAARRAASLAQFGTAAEAWNLARRFRAELVETSALTVLDPPATAAIEAALELEPPSSEPRWSVLRLFEGNAGAVEALEGTARRFEAECGSGASFHVLPERSIEEGVQRLAEFQEPGELERRDLVVLRLSALPAKLEDLQDRLGSFCSSAECVSEGCTAEPSSGFVILRARGERENLQRLLAALSGVCRDQLSGRLLFASRAVKLRQPFLLRPDANLGLSRAIQRVFDPDQTFHVERVSTRHYIEPAREDVTAPATTRNDSQPQDA